MQCTASAPPSSSSQESYRNAAERRKNGSRRDGIASTVGRRFEDFENPEVIRAELWECSRTTGCGSRAIESLARLRRSLKMTGEAPSERDYVSALTSLARDKRWRAALRLLVQASRSPNINTDAYMYSAAMTACARAGEWKRALVVLRDAEARGKCDRAVYNAALHACAGQKQWEECVSVYERMVAAGIQANVVSYAAVVSACASCAQWTRAEELSERMIRDCYGIGVVPAANILLAVRNGRAFHRALMLVVEKDEIAGLEAELGWTGEDRLAMADRIARAIDTAGDTKRAWAPGDVFLTCVSSREWELAECVMQQGSALGAPLTAVHIKAAIHAVEDMDAAATLMATLSKRDAQHCASPLELSIELAAKTARCGLPDDAMRIMDTVIADAEPDELVRVNPTGPFNCIIRSFTRTRDDYEGACVAMRKMRDAGVEWNNGTVHAGLRSIRACLDGDLAMLAYKTSTGARTPALYETVAETLRLCGRIEDADAVMREWTRRKLG